MKKFSILAGALMMCQLLVAQDTKYFGIKKTIPKIPPREQQIRTIIVSDAANEIDDVWAIALAILYPKRFHIEGFVGSNFDHTWLAEGHRSISLSVGVIDTILTKAKLRGKYPVYPGSDPMQYEFAPSVKKCLLP
jgi:purine nucleosidase